ncbi:MAG TPA: diaminobutyrate acetyltransferase [Gammaproteobacteria bacterium]|nr:diaminobutyrate acetyltransferase [Gammaproteobacteria bacterium]
MKNRIQDIQLRPPDVADGSEIWRIVKDSGTLDLNSAYLYLLLCKDFPQTCVVAEQNGRLVGFATGYRPPERDDVIFLWQIGVDAALRGQGLGKRLLTRFLDSEGARGTSYLETTISPSNQASQKLFRGLARDLGTECQVSPCFTADQFPNGHEAEDLYRIGPFGTATLRRLTT